MKTSSSSLKIGWASIDITPVEFPVSIQGQLYLRVSEGVRDPLTATVLVLDSQTEHVIFVSCDLISIADKLREAVYARLAQHAQSSDSSPSLDPAKIIFNATHTHTAPQLFQTPEQVEAFQSLEKNHSLYITHPSTYLAYAADQIATAIQNAWNARNPGSIAFGQDFAVVGRNRRWVDFQGKATMYRLNENTQDAFSHIEGYEDHSLNMIATYDSRDQLTGLLLNLPSPSQEEEGRFLISADFWHETRQELRKLYGENLFVLPQCSAAGDLTSHVLFETKAHERMLQIRNRSGREEVAARITDAVRRTLPHLAAHKENNPLLLHHIESLDLPSNQIQKSHVDDARAEIKILQAEYEAESQKLKDNPDLYKQPQWYVPITKALWKRNWHQRAITRYEEQQQQRTINVHVIRLGEIAFANNPFEYYLDFGIQIKVRSPFTQTFLIQLSGEGSYVPSLRSVAGGGYGSVPASNAVGPEGGQKLADYTLNKLQELFEIST